MRITVVIIMSTPTSSLSNIIILFGIAGGICFFSFTRVVDSYLKPYLNINRRLYVRLTVITLAITVVGFYGMRYWGL